MQRRTHGLKAIALAGALVASLFTALPGAGANGTGGLPTKFDLDLLSDNSSGRAIVGFTHDVSSSTIERLAAAGVTEAVRLDTIDAVGVLASVSAYKTIAGWNDVTFVDADSRLRMQNYAAKKDTKVDKVREGVKPLDRKYTGKGVTVAVVDTGIQPHPDLEDRVVANLNFEPAWFMDMINDGKYSDQLVEATGNPIDSYGHGTHVAGIVAGTGAFAEDDVDMSGVAPKAHLVNVKIADVHEGLVCDIPCDFGWEINALVAYEYIIEHRKDKLFPGGIRIATNSWSIYEVDSEVEPISLIVDAASKKGMVSVFAAGNDGPDKNTVAQGPNRLESVITVGAACKSVDSCGKGKIAEFSSRGPQVDVAAPGDNIYSAMAQASALWPIGSHSAPGSPANNLMYVGFSGTSMATPHVAGIVALMLEADPNLTPARVERILTRTADDLGDRGFDTSFGHGMVNAFDAVKRAER
ncbi:MAG: S8 family peptidase [Actinomycetota bacterium]